jgi:hypothetical protein
MINLWVAVRNPFRCKEFCSLWNREWRLTKNKTLELQFSEYRFNILEFQLDLNWRQTDHAGPWLMINLFGYSMDLRIYDNRHWDDTTNTWGTLDVE